MNKMLQNNEKLLLSILTLQQSLHRMSIENKFEQLQKLPRYNNKKNLIPFGKKIYSQNEEDGIINEIFNRIGTTNKIFVEFGIGNGLENNTLALLFDNWKGLWIESRQNMVDEIERNLQKVIKEKRLEILNAMVNTENINQLISSAIDEKEIDLLSIDIDGNDFHIFNAINCITARVVVIEYNAKFIPPVEYCMKYNPDHLWDGTDNFGASLQFLEKKMKEKGYLLVGCNLTGTNAFFVRADLEQGKFEPPFTAKKHFQPARYYLLGLFSGHRPSFKTLENAL